MSNVRVVDLLPLESNSSPTNFLTRSKKIPPPPLSLPIPNTTTDEEKIVDSNQNHDQKKSTNNCCCLSSSTKECPHKSVPYTLPVGQRPQILDTLITSSSTLLVPPSSEPKQKKSQTSVNSNQINKLKQHHASRQGIVTDTEWLDFIRMIVHKPLENELTLLLDKYKTTYFDRVNAPNTTDATIRASLCAIASEALTTYSTSSSLPATSAAIMDDTLNNILPCDATTVATNNNNSKRKRKNTRTNLSEPATMTIDSRTKFVISHIIPGKCDNTINGSKIINQQRYKQFQKKYSHLFKYVPDKEEQVYLTREGHLKNTSAVSSRSSNNNNNNICLMLHDEVLIYMDEYDLELSGISINDSFTLSESMLEHIHPSI